MYVKYKKHNEKKKSLSIDFLLMIIEVMILEGTYLLQTDRQ